MKNKFTSLFAPYSLGETIELRNRIVMAPMTTWSANPDGTILIKSWHFMNDAPGMLDW